MSWINLVAVLVFLGSWAFGQRPSKSDKQSKGAIRTVCEASAGLLAGKATISGTARLTRDGLVLGDFTCPTARSENDALVMLVLIDVREFSQSTDRLLYDATHSSLSASRSAVFNVVVNGAIECRKGFSVETNGSGEFLFGNGFGYQGLAKCRIRSARVLQLQEVK